MDDALATFLDLNPELQADGEVVTVEDAEAKRSAPPYSLLASSMPKSYDAATFDSRLYISQRRDDMNISALNASIYAGMLSEGWDPSSLERQARYEMTISRPATLLAPNTLSFDVSSTTRPYDPQPGSCASNVYAVTSSNLSVSDLIRVSTPCGNRHYGRVATLLPDGHSFTMCNTTQDGALMGGNAAAMLCNTRVLYTVHGIRLYDYERIARINLVRLPRRCNNSNSSSSGGPPALFQGDFNAPLYRLLYDAGPKLFPAEGPRCEHGGDAGYGGDCSNAANCSNDCHDCLDVCDVSDDRNCGDGCDDGDATPSSQRAFEDYRDRWAQGDIRVARASDIHNNNSPFNAFTDLGVSNLFVATAATMRGHMSAGDGVLVVAPASDGPCDTSVGGCVSAENIPGTGEVSVTGTFRVGSNLTATPTSVDIESTLTVASALTVASNVVTMHVPTVMEAGLTVTGAPIVGLAGIGTPCMYVWNQFGFGADPSTDGIPAPMWPVVPPWDPQPPCPSPGLPPCQQPPQPPCHPPCHPPLQSTVDTLRVDQALFIGDSGWVLEQAADVEVPPGGATLLLTHPTLQQQGISHMFSADGRVGLGVDAASFDEGHGFRLTVEGDALVTGVIQNQSDSRLKTDVEPIKDALSRVLALTGYTFAMKEGGAAGTPTRRLTGLLAQEVDAVMPEATQWDAASGMGSIAYAHLAGLFVQAIKELHAQVEELQRVHSMQPRSRAPIFPPGLPIDVVRRDGAVATTSHHPDQERC